MIYDRPYMRADGRRPSTWTAMHWILYGTVAVFLLQLIAEAWFKSPVMSTLFALSGESIRSGYVWTLVTYGFLHGTEGFWLVHIGINMLILYLFGRHLVGVIGNKLFWWLYLVSTLVGGTVWLLFNFTRGVPVVGASGAVFGVVICFICMNPSQRIGFFFIPVSFTPKTIAYILLGYTAIGFLFFELPGATNVAHSAHLGGALAGYLFFKLIYGSLPELGSQKPRVEMPQWFRKKPKRAPQTGKFQVNISNRRDLQAEVDRILDKINSDGFGSLTDEEKKILDQAKDILSR